MSQANRQYELIVLGATGYTGKLVAEWVTTHLPEDLKWAIAGRNTKKLHAVVDELTKLNPNRKQPDIETCSLEKSELNTLAKRTKLLISTIGPFLLYGEPVLAACAENGTHYLDSTGEVPWVYDMIAKYHDLAVKNNAIIIPECGLDSVPADILSYILAQEVRKQHNAPCERAIVSLYDLKSGFSGGTLLTMLEIVSNYSLRQLARSMHPYSLSPVKPAKALSSPKGNRFLPRLFGLVSIPELGGIQTTYIMGGVDICITHRSWGLYESTAKSYGPNFRFNEYMHAKSFVAGAVVKFAIGLAGLMITLPPMSWILVPFLKKFVVKAGTGPAKEAMKEDFLAHHGIGIAEGSGGKKQVMVKAHTAHGGYSFTGLSLSAAASVILRGRLQDTHAGKLGGGILTPATLGDQFVERLNDFGMKIEVQK